jgi:hypothetical protein
MVSLFLQSFAAGFAFESNALSKLNHEGGFK